LDTPPGYVLGPPPIRITVERERGSVTVTVRDNTFLLLFCHSKLDKDFENENDSCCTTLGVKTFILVQITSIQYVQVLSGKQKTQFQWQMRYENNTVIPNETK
jgi:hypothetical protein